jgi:SAM-dependent methyltransferase
MDNVGERLVCPHCHQSLENGRDSLVCVGCCQQYPIRSGVPCFGQTDDFYEGRWVAPDLSSGSIRNLLVKKERFFWRWLRNRRGSLLDLGCGGGWRLYTRTGPVAGVDVSISSLQSAKTIYQQVAQSSLERLPFPDESFDFVVSSDVLGHVALPDKDRVLQEIRRVLRPGGLTLHYVEAEGNDPLMRFAQRYPQQYQRYIIEPEGHIGLESAGQIFDRFRRLSFQPLEERAVYRGPLYVGRVAQYFDNEYRRKSRRINVLVAVSKLIMRAKWLEMAANLGITGLLELTDRICPPSWAGGALVCYRK